MSAAVKLSHLAGVSEARACRRNPERSEEYVLNPKRSEVLLSPMKLQLFHRNPKTIKLKICPGTIPGGEVWLKLCCQSRGQRLHVRDADAGDKIVAWTSREGPIVSAGDIAEARAPG